MAAAEWFLIPLRHGAPLGQTTTTTNTSSIMDSTTTSSSSSNCYIALSKTSTIGRRELMEGTRRACGCFAAAATLDKDATTTTTTTTETCTAQQVEAGGGSAAAAGSCQQLEMNVTNDNGEGDDNTKVSTYCQECRQANEWAMEYLSRQVLKVVTTIDGSDSSSRSTRDLLQVSGTNSHWMLRINRRQVPVGSRGKTTRHDVCRAAAAAAAAKKKSLVLTVPLKQGMIVGFKYPYKNNSDCEQLLDSSGVLEFRVQRTMSDRDGDDGSIKGGPTMVEHPRQAATTTTSRLSKRAKQTHSDGERHDENVTTNNGYPIEDMDVMMEEAMRTSSEATNSFAFGGGRPLADTLVNATRHDDNDDARGSGVAGDTIAGVVQQTLGVIEKTMANEQDRTCHNDHYDKNEARGCRCNSNHGRAPRMSDSTLELYKNCDNASPSSSCLEEGGGSSGAGQGDDDTGDGVSIDKQYSTRNARPSNHHTEVATGAANADDDSTLEDIGDDGGWNKNLNDEDQDEWCRLESTQDLMDYLDRDIHAQQDQEERLMSAGGQWDDETNVQSENDVLATQTTTSTTGTTAQSRKSSLLDDGPNEDQSSKPCNDRRNEAIDPSADCCTGSTCDHRYAPTNKKRPSTESSPIELLSDDDDDDDDDAAGTHNGEPRVVQDHFKVMFVKGGATMTSRIVAGLSQRAKSRGALVVDSLKENPTHLILDPHVKVDTVVSALQFRNAKKLVKALDERHILTVKRDWIISGADGTLKRPTLDQLWNGLASIQSERKLTCTDTLTKPKTKARQSQRPTRKTVTPYAINKHLSDHFHELSKLQQECALAIDNPHKAYMMNLQAGRLRYLEFEVSLDNLDQLKNIKGMGPSAIKTVKEYLESGGGRCRRREEYEADEHRMAMRTLKKIWGVGESAAEGLIKNGYRTIDQVRRDLRSGVLTTLTTNQKIGVANYEVFLEKMDREEVETIADICSKVILEYCPQAKVDIMGSYRRGKGQCGDIDLLITDPGYMKTTPRGALGKIVDRLKGQGHISHHLTHLEGMTYGSSDSQSSYASSQEEGLPPPPPIASGGKESSASYMGVFHSPCELGKKRRIDIKFYPYRERVFASLYFTGNGWFNRSMRLWAKRAKNLSLSDHGLFPITQTRVAANVPHASNRLHMKASTEREVFEYLELVYKDPTDRNFFDDVIPLDPNANHTELSQAEFKEEDEV